MSFWVRGNEFLGFGNEFHDFGNEFPHFGGNEFRPKRTKKSLDCDCFENFELFRLIEYRFKNSWMKFLGCNRSLK